MSDRVPVLFTSVSHLANEHRVAAALGTAWSTEDELERLTKSGLGLSCIAAHGMGDRPRAEACT